MTLTATTPLQPPANLPFAALGERDRLLGRTLYLASRSCKEWTSSPSSTKNYATEMGRRHRESQRQPNPTASSDEPAVLRELLQFDAC